MLSAISPACVSKAKWPVSRRRTTAHLVCAGTGQIEVIEVLAIWRHHRLIGNAVGVLPMCRLRLGAHFDSPATGLASTPAMRPGAHSARKNLHLVQTRKRAGEIACVVVFYRAPQPAQRAFHP